MKRIPSHPLSNHDTPFSPVSQLVTWPCTSCIYWIRLKIHLTRPSIPLSHIFQVHLFLWPVYVLPYLGGAQVKRWWKRCYWELLSGSVRLHRRVCHKELCSAQWLFRISSGRAERRRVVSVFLSAKQPAKMSGRGRVIRETLICRVWNCFAFRSWQHWGNFKLIWSASFTVCFGVQADQRVQVFLCHSL